MEETLYQTKNRSRQDPLNYPIRLTNKLAHINSLTNIGDFKPTASAYEVKAELTALIDKELADYKMLLEVELPKLNQMIRSGGVDLIKGPE